MVNDVIISDSSWGGHVNKTLKDGRYNRTKVWGACKYSAKKDEAGIDSNQVRVELMVGEDGEGQIW